VKTNKVPTLYFITYRISTALTGGEFCSRLLLSGAQNAGFKVETWEGIRYNSLVKRIFLINLLFLYKALFIPPKSFLLLDLDFHARYVFALLWARHVKKAKIVGLLYHYNYWDKNNPVSRMLHLGIEALVSKRCDYLITISKFSAENFRALSGRNVPVFIQTPFFRNPRPRPAALARFNHAAPRLLFVGSVERRKNVINTIKAVALLSGDFAFDIVGFWPSAGYLAKVRAAIRSMALENRVILHGKIDGDQLCDKYSSATMFILVSRMEGYGMVYAEAMAFGLPIVATTRGAVPELVEEGTNGFLCDPEKIVQIAEAIQKLNNREIWERISANNLKKAETFKTSRQFESEGGELFKRIIFGSEHPRAANNLP
jgi:glycosyltransferase involved in cell wall biosynthesis